MTTVSTTQRQAEPRVALRIRMVARRCPGGEPGKARFFGDDGGALIVEDLVLRRWRQRRSPIETFHGCRLPPRTWDVVKACLEAGFALRPGTTVENLHNYIVQVRAQLPHWKPPPAVHLFALLQFLNERRVLQEILNRQRDFESPGLPDLALYRRRLDGRVCGVIFAEVKRSVGRWRESVSKAQKSELLFLRSLGLKAGVARVIELHVEGAEPR